MSDETSNFVTDPEMRARQIEADEVEALTQAGATRQHQASQPVAADPAPADAPNPDFFGHVPSPEANRGLIVPREGQQPPHPKPSRERQFIRQLFNPDSADWTQH